MKTSRLINNHYKECSPDETKSRIKSILSSKGILTEKKSELKSAIDTDSVRLVIKGTDIGTNGKGINASFADASAYAEFMERLQNLHLDSFTQLLPERFEGFYLFPDERIISYDELLNQKDSFMDYFFEQTGLNREDFRNIHCLDSKRTNTNNSYICVPFWDYKENRKVYLPYTIYRPWYGSNGMCAGNSPEEALVQGLSEILERYVMKKIISEQISLPCIPEEYIKRFPYIFEKYKKLSDDSRLHVRLFDCSLGGCYPVAGLLVVKKNTGNYGIKLGAHPNYVIAIERAMTEATQGRDILSFADNSYLDFSNEDVFSESNLANCFMTGEGQYPYMFFNQKPRYEFFEPKDVSMMNNQQLFSKMIEQIQLAGYHVLIRNVTYMGFPTFHIIIPNMSETGIVTLEDYKMIQLLNDSVESFRNPQNVNMENAIDLMKVLDHFSYQRYLSFFMHTQDNRGIPWEYAGESVHYYQAALSAALGDYANCIHYLTLISQSISKGYILDEDKDWLLSLMYYISARQLIESHEEIMSYMKVFFDEYCCIRLDELFGVQEETGCLQFNSTLFQKMVKRYTPNSLDKSISDMMYQNRKAMVNNMPQQCRIG